MRHGPHTRYVKLRVAHAPGLSGTFSPPARVSDADMHHGTCVTHVPWCMPGTQTSGFHWSRWRGKRSWHSRQMRNPQFCVSGKRPIAVIHKNGLAQDSGNSIPSMLCKYSLSLSHRYIISVPCIYFQLHIFHIVSGGPCGDLLLWLHLHTDPDWISISPTTSGVFHCS